jgi:catechol 2,3-dioxygenase-like lactoylglutathione lyase family enzyme
MISPPSIDQQITFLYTHDLSKTARFYENVLGLPLKLDQGTCKIYTVTAGSFLGFCERVGAGQSYTNVILTLVTSQVDEWFEYLSSQGITFEKPPTINPDYNIYHCFLRDPNGYLIEIQEFLDPAW